MSHTLIFGQDEALTAWAQKRIPWSGGARDIRAVGVNDGPERTDKLLAVCLYFNFVDQYDVGGKPWGLTCEIGFAADSPRWATRRTITNLLRIPFLQYKCRKVYTVIPSINKRAIEFNIGIGLRVEGTLRSQFAPGVHASVHGMLKHEYERRWLTPRAPAGRMEHGRREGRELVSATSA
jgi:RimJ/RimL family protein N-acetyltransferase